MGARLISKRIIKDIIIVAVGVLVIWIGLQVFFGTQNPFYVVSSGSMVPELLVFDVLVVQGNIPFEEIKVGDVIVFDRPSDHNRVIVHRVAEILDDDPYTVRTKGDANPASIRGTDFPITDDEYIGKVEYVIPQIGYITRILTPPVNYIVIAVIVGIMVFKEISKSRKEKEKKSLLEEQKFETEDTDAKEDIETKEKISDIPPDEEYSKTDEQPNSSDEVKNDKQGSESSEKKPRDGKEEKS